MNGPAQQIPLSGDPLAGLRDYHLPDPVAWWPPAPGWWVLLGVLLIACVATLWWWQRRRRCTAAARAALRELERLHRRTDPGADGIAYLRGLSRLLRRYARVAFPGQPVAALTGDAWLTFLDAHGGAGRFRDGPGRLLADAPYRAVADGRPDELATLVRDWIRHNRGGCR